MAAAPGAGGVTTPGRVLPAAALALLGLSVAAFWPDYLGRIGSVDPYTHVHAALGLAWLLLLIAQPRLALARKVALHRSLGRAGVIVGAAFLVASVLLTHHRASRMDAEAFERFGHFLYLPILMTAIFAGSLLLALRWRRSPALHARYMACSALALVDPVSARLLHFYGPQLPADFMYQLPAFAIIAGVLLGLLRTLPPATAGRGAFKVFAAATGVLLLLYFATPYSDAWLRLLGAFRALPLT